MKMRLSADPTKEIQLQNNKKKTGKGSNMSLLEELSEIDPVH
jgi:hypothetical protein